MEINDSEITFSSGRTAYANQGIIGISPDLSLSEGYDGELRLLWDENHENHELSPADKQELADYMIEQWTKFKESITESS